MNFLLFLLFFTLVEAEEPYYSPYFIDNGLICTRDVPRNTFASNSTHVYIAATHGNEMIGDVDVAVMCGLEHIREDPNILNGVQVELVRVDDYNSAFGGISAGVAMEHCGLKYSVGPAYSSAGKAISTLANIFDINVIGATTSSPELSNSDPAAGGFKYFSRVFPSDVYQGKNLAKLAEHFGWKKVATYSTSPNSYYDGIINEFIAECNTIGIETYSATTPLSATREQVKNALEKIKMTGIRVVLFSGEDWVLMQEEAEKLGMLDEGWAWLASEEMFGYVRPDQYEKFSGFIGMMPALNENATLWQKLTTCMQTHENDVTGMYANMTYSDQYSMWGYFHYDALYVMAMAIDKMRNDPLPGISDLTEAEQLTETIRSLEVEGTSGKITMDSNGDRLGAIYNIYNIDDSKDSLVQLGSITTDTLVVNFIPDTQVLFNGNTNEIPVEYIMTCSISEHFEQNLTDCNPQRTVSYTPKTADAALYCDPVESTLITCDYPMPGNTGVIISIVGLVFILIMFAMLMVNWSHKLILLSQRRFLLCMCIGALLGQITPILTVGERTVSKCQLGPIMICTGYLLMIAPLVLKTWRVSILTSLSSMKKKTISDAFLFRRLLVLLTINSVIMALIVIKDNIGVKEVSQAISDGDLVHKIPNQVCATESNTFSTLIIFYLGMFNLAGCYMSYQTRKVHENLSESQWIFMAIYNQVIWALLGLYFNYLIEVDSANQFVFTSICISFATVSTLSLVLVPKFLNIQKGVEPTITNSNATAAPTTAMTSTSVAPS